MLVTRPEPDGLATAERLRALNIEAISCPVLVRETLPVSLPEAKGFAALAITSGNALRSLAERDALSSFLSLPLYAVGEHTAEEARGLGFAQVIAAEGSLASLAQQLAHAKLEGPVFYPAARDPAGDLARSLAPFGVMVVTAKIYTMEPVSRLPASVLSELEAREIGAALFYSRRSAECFVELVADHLSREKRTSLGVLCLSEAVAEPLVDAHFVRISLADKPSENAMMSLALSFARDQSQA